MKKFLLSLFIFAATCQTHAQDATSYTIAPGTDSLYKWHLSEPDAFGFEPVENSHADYTFRLTYNYTSIILYKNNGEAWGWAKNYITESGAPNNVFGMTFIIDAITAEKLITLVDSTKISLIPSKQFIKDWPSGFDGRAYVIEQKTGGSYSYKYYWEPGSHNIPESDSIKLFIDRFETIGKIETIISAVHKQRPFLNYNAGTNMQRVHIVSKKELEYWEQRKQNYLSSKRRETTVIKPD